MEHEFKLICDLELMFARIFPEENFGEENFLDFEIISRFQL